MFVSLGAARVQANCRNDNVGGVGAEVCILVFKENRPFAGEHIFGPDPHRPASAGIADLTDLCASPIKQLLIKISPRNAATEVKQPVWLHRITDTCGQQVGPVARVAGGVSREAAGIQPMRVLLT